MAKVKAHCPSCSARMKPKDKFCGGCGRRNPLFPAEPSGAAKSASRPVLVKSAPAASVSDVRSAQLRREILREPDPAQRQVPIGQLVDLMKGGVA